MTDNKSLQQDKIRTHDELFRKSLYMVSWTRKQMEISESYAFKDQASKGKPYVSMGDIYYAFLGTNIGSEIDKERPVMIFQGNDRFIRQSNMTVVIPMTSSRTSKPYRVKIQAADIFDNEGISECSILVQQIRSISKARLTLFKGRCSVEKIREVANEVQKLFYKDIPLLLEGDAQTANEGAAKM